MNVSKDIFKDWMIVVVDDEPDAAAILKDVLEFYGATVQIAYHVHGALGLIQSCKPQFIITDLMMPGFSGIDLLESLQAAEGELAQIPVVGMTAYLKPNDKKPFYQLGFRYFLTKPIKVTEVVGDLVSQLKDDLPGLRARLDPPE